MLFRHLSSFVLMTTLFFTSYSTPVQAGHKDTNHIILSGGFCTGKTTLINMLANEFEIKKLPAYTTRAMRPGEKEGMPYFFLTKELFNQYKEESLLFDIATVNNQQYAVMRSDLQKKEWILDILSSSLPTYKAEVPDAISIYLHPPSEEELIRRATERGDSIEQIEKRIDLLKKENPQGFDYYLSGDLSIQEKYDFIRKILFEKGTSLKERS